MITAVDTNVLLDLLLEDERFVEKSHAALARCAAEGALVACDVVVAELAGVFGLQGDAEGMLGEAGIAYVPTAREAALRAGRCWADYRSRGGNRTRVVADFLVAAHAEHHADRLLTRDRGFYRSYFSSLMILDPTD